MKKIFTVITMIFTLLISACSCDKFDADTYERAVKNLKNSTGFEYKLTITTKTEGQSYYLKEESNNAYRLTTTGIVENFASTLKSYNISAPNNGPEGAPTLVYSLNRYYVGEENKFYIKETAINSIENKKVESKKYEEVYNDINDKYNTANLVPTFSKEQITGFQISEIKGNKGYSRAVFTAPTPSFIESNEEVALYSVTMDKDFYFKTLEVYVVGEGVSITYQYEFLNYNGDVEIVFPADLVNY